jgi:hypothetical protein
MELAELLRHKFTFAGCRVLQMSIFVRLLVQSTVKLNFTVQVQIGARAYASVTLHKIRVWFLSAPRIKTSHAASCVAAFVPGVFW